MNEMNFYYYDIRTNCLRIKREYSLQLNQCENSISIERKEKDQKKQSPKYVLGAMSADIVDSQLANIKHIGFEVTDACNLKCDYCTYGELYDNYDIRQNKEMNFNKAKVLLDFLIDKINSSKNYSLLNDILISFYGGEPLLNFKLIKNIVEYTQCKQNDNLKFHYAVTTNGIFLRKYIEYLFKYNFLVTVSLDGNKRNNAYRKFSNGCESFDIVYDHLKYIQFNYRDFFDNNIRFNSVLSNLNDKYEVFDFIYHEFNKIPRFSEINPSGIKYSRRDDYLKMKNIKHKCNNQFLLNEMQNVLDLSFEDRNILQDLILQYSGNVYSTYNDLLFDKRNLKMLPTATCIPFSRRIFMTVNNKILPCERIGQQYFLGYVTDENVFIDSQYISDIYNKFYDSLKRQCNDCYLINSCSQCMFNIDALGTNKCICDKKCDQDKFNKYLYDNIQILLKSPELYKRIITETFINE